MARDLVDDARLADARKLVPLARVLCDQAKALADTIGRTERRFGTVEIMHLARLTDDVWMSLDSFIADVQGWEYRQHQLKAWFSISFGRSIPRGRAISSRGARPTQPLQIGH